jgi:peptide/nickel transport system permease protein
MLYYIGRRLLILPPVMLTVALIVFCLLYITPGDPAAMIAGDQATPEDIDRIRISMGLDKPFLIRFATWAWQLLNGDLGMSIFANQPVTQMIGQRIGPTFSLLAMSLVISVVIAIPLGVFAAWKRGKTADRVFMGVTVLSFSFPVFVVGYLLAFSFSTTLKWLPVQGYTPLAEGVAPFLKHLILPALTLGVSYAAILARTTRSSMLDVLSQEYIRTAVAKGAGPRILLFRHALKNAAIPIITVIGLGLATLIGGSVITESVFAIPGIGRLTLDAILHRDYPVIQGVVLLFSAGYVAINLLIDVIYTLVDPRIRY